MGLSIIQWCDYTFNPWIGCRMAKTVAGKPIEECFLCYAKELDDNRFSKTLGGASKEHPVSHWGSGPRHRTSAANWKEPLKWNRFRVCNECGVFVPDDESHFHISMARAGHRRPRVFCLSLGDWLDDENVPIEWLADLLGIIEQTHNLDWLLLTKRPQTWRVRLASVVELNCASRPGAYSRGGQLAERWIGGDAPHNVWIGVSAGADQAAALEIPARVHFLSCEPMLRPLSFEHARRFDWIIFGGESGKKARPCNIAWIDEGLALCRTYKIAAFVKQLGAKPYYEPIPAHRITARWPVACDAEHPLKLKDSHGGDMSEWPEDLRVRQFPKLPHG